MNKKSKYPRWAPREFRTQWICYFMLNANYRGSMNSNGIAKDKLNVILTFKSQESAQMECDVLNRKLGIII